MIYVDTSAFYAYLSREDPDHGKVVEAVRACLEADSALVASSYVIAETMGLVQHRLGLASLTRFVEDMLPLVQVQWIAAGEHDAAWRLLARVKKRSFTIVDASTAVLMQRDGVNRILALDPEFRRLGFVALPAPGASASPGARGSKGR